MGKNQKEKQMLYEWGMNHYSKDIFVQPDQTKESYFLQRPDDVYLKEYQFDTLPDFIEELEGLWINDETMESIKKVIAVAAMKNKPVKMDENNKQRKNQMDQDEELPVYIYNF